MSPRVRCFLHDLTGDVVTFWIEAHRCLDYVRNWIDWRNMHSIVITLDDDKQDTFLVWTCKDLEDM